ncbi:MAG: hypothetical protein ACOC3T_00885 [Bacteroidota bacterium]
MNKITLDKLLFLVGTVIFQISISSVFSSTPQLFIDDYAVIDSSRIVVRYSLEFVANHNKPETIDNDIIVLEIGSKISKSYSYGLYKHDSIATMNKNSAQPFFKARVPPLEVLKTTQLAIIPLFTGLQIIRNQFLFIKTLWISIGNSYLSENKL